ncbi:MAG: hypothetical protein ACPH5N_06725, partial [Pseudomonadales bacterium]
GHEASGSRQIMIGHGAGHGVRNLYAGGTDKSNQTNVFIGQDAGSGLLNLTYETHSSSLPTLWLHGSDTNSLEYHALGGLVSIGKKSLEGASQVKNCNH